MREGPPGFAPKQGPKGLLICVFLPGIGILPTHHPFVASSGDRMAST
jgi:hypothetical protein